MGKTSTAIKNQYNKEKYKQVKICVTPETAASFKVVCEAANVSMSSEIIGFIERRIKATSNVSAKNLLMTKAGRRKLLFSILQQLEQIKDAEETYMDNIPENLQSSVRYESAEDCVSGIEAAIDALNNMS